MSKDVKKKAKAAVHEEAAAETREEIVKDSPKEDIPLEEGTPGGTASENAAPEGETEASVSSSDAASEEASDGEEGKKDERDEKIAELSDRNLRLMAEFENFRKRSEKEKEQMFENGAKSVIEKVLPVIDNFERALCMTSQDGAEEKEADPFMEGMQKVYKQLMDELSKIGVKPIEAVGTEFNPEFHNAVMQVDSEEYDSGIVASEMQRGYMYNDSVVRHSMVGVAK